MPRTIVLVTFQHGTALDLVGPLDVFAAANDALDAKRSRAERYALVVASTVRGPVAQESGISVVATHSLGALPRSIDTLLIAGGRGARLASTQPRVVARIAALAPRARRVASVCTGAFVLASAGLLDGRRATTHWTFCEAFAQRFPSVEVDADPIFVRDGSRYTSAGVTAGIDLALALVEEDHGPELASAVARTLVVFVRRAGGQSQFSAPLRAQSAERAPLRALQAELVEHPEAPTDLASLAKRVGMSPRHFSRVFHAETGATPAAFVASLRLDAARRLLETTALSVDEVAIRSGLRTPKSLHRQLHAHIGLSPREYRARFGRA